jgi:hypothetical protein
MAELAYFPPRQKLAFGTKEVPIKMKDPFDSGESEAALLFLWAPDWQQRDSVFYLKKIASEKSKRSTPRLDLPGDNTSLGPATESFKSAENSRGWLR